MGPGGGRGPPNIGGGGKLWVGVSGGRAFLVSRTWILTHARERRGNGVCCHGNQNIHTHKSIIYTYVDFERIQHTHTMQ